MPFDEDMEPSLGGTPNQWQGKEVDKAVWETCDQLKETYPHLVNKVPFEYC